jgi:hypothetical protein
MPQDLDRRDELVEVHVQHPPRHAPVLPGRAVMSNAWVGITHPAHCRRRCFDAP